MWLNKKAPSKTFISRIKRKVFLRMHQLLTLRLKGSKMHCEEYCPFKKIFIALISIRNMEIVLKTQRGCHAQQSFCPAGPRFRLLFLF